jgi:hypothetical protein
MPAESALITDESSRSKPSDTLLATTQLSPTGSPSKSKVLTLYPGTSHQTIVLLACELIFVKRVDLDC